VIDRLPTIRDEGILQSGEELQLDESITFDKVTFKYPTALLEHNPTLQEASFSIPAGLTTAIVGPSGSGKSTIIQLIERFYDP
jgi:ABC-type multidrug transport system fused ATPase/permease subunit